MKELIAIQEKLKAPKNQKNSFGHYNYRSCEDILEAVKPICVEHNCLLTLSDEVIMLGDRFYVKATASINDGNTSVSVSAYAREQQAKYNKEGKETMDHAQITGSTSSYARKYALNGLFCIDDTKDADTMDNTVHKPEKANKQPFNEYKAPEVKQMTSIQKSTLKDQIVALKAIGSESANKAITAIDTMLGFANVPFDEATKMIKKCNITIEKA